MTESEIFDILKIILTNEIGIQSPLTLETGLFKEKLIDSMDWLSYITKVEEKFNISISDSDGDEFQLGIIQNMVKYLKARL